MSAHVRNLPWSLGPLDWIPAAEPARIEESEKDSSVRAIGLTVFLEDPRARTPYVHVQLPKQTEYGVNTGEAVVDIWLRASSEQGFLASILLGTQAPSPREAFNRSYALALSLLSSWSFQAQRPVSIRETLIEDKGHRAAWVVRPQAQVPLQLNDIEVSLAPANPIGSLLALFREGMASPQPAYRFLCYYKILEAWHGGHGPFKRITEELAAVDGNAARRLKLMIQPEMFEGKCDRSKYEHLIGKKFTWCFDQMNEGRKFLAHPFDAKGTFVSLDDPATIAALSDVANLAERMVIEILVEEIRVIKSLDTSGTTERVVSSYVHESWGADLLRT
jgi:Methylamine utilization protein MauJ